jgi:hypothetical protein
MGSRAMPFASIKGTFHRRGLWISIVVLALGVGVLDSAAASRAGSQGTVEPPQCPLHSTKQFVINAGTTPNGHAPLYLRACGPAHARWQLQEKTYRADGGFCTFYPVTTPEGERRRFDVVTGMVTNLGSTPVDTAAWLVMVTRRPVAAGPVNVVDSEIQVPGRPIAATGVAILRKRGRAGSFWLTARGDSSVEGQLITGSWTCRLKKTP